MLNCREMTEVVTAYLEGSLPIMTRMGIWMHISMCRHCRRYFRQLEAMTKATGKAPPIDMPDDVRASLEATFERAAADWQRADADASPDGERP